MSNKQNTEIENEKYTPVRVTYSCYKIKRRRNNEKRNSVFFLGHQEVVIFFVLFHVIHVTPKRVISLVPKLVFRMSPV